MKQETKWLIFKMKHENLIEGIKYGIWQCTFGYIVIIVWHFLDTGWWWFP